MKSKTVYLCIDCGHREHKWLGRCPECGAWNTFEERAENTHKKSGEKKLGIGLINQKSSYNPVSIHHIATDIQTRITTITEMDQVLGGGIVLGSSILIGGEPGIGKSTLMSQIADACGINGNVLYISGEESPEQIKIRADRLGLKSNKFTVLCENDIDIIMDVINNTKPGLIIVDSIQTLVSSDLGSVPGTVSQLKYCCYELISWIKNSRSALFLVAHVTKDGAIAGPKVIEHLVDTVIYFDQVGSGLRVVRAVKNRFGSVDEIGIFTMEKEGLKQVSNPSALFMIHREEEIPQGIAPAPVYEGSRVLLMEIQALVVPAKGNFSRIYSDKIDSSRVSRIAAVIEKHLSISFSNQDIYVNVAGGIRLHEVGIELPLAMALISARTGISLIHDTIGAGEISLAGEIRPTPHMERRFKAAREMGFTHFIGPINKEKSLGKEYTAVSTISEGVKYFLGQSYTS